MGRGERLLQSRIVLNDDQLRTDGLSPSGDSLSPRHEVMQPERHVGASKKGHISRVVCRTQAERH